jgi:hypothetical protein
MNKSEAINRAGGCAALAKMLGIRRQAVWKWVRIPAARLETLRELRPEWFRRIK